MPVSTLHHTFLFAISLLFLVSSAQPATLVPVTGKAASAELQGCQSDGTFLFEIGDNRQSLSADQFVRWGKPIDDNDGPLVCLADGSCISAISDSLTQPRIADEQLSFDSKSLGDNIRLPLELVRAIILQPPEEPTRRDGLVDRVRRADNTTDVLVLDNGDELRGTVTGLNDDEFLIQVAGGSVVKQGRNRVLAIVFNPALVQRVPKAESLLVAHLADGSRLVARSWSGDGKQVRIEIADGTEFSVRHPGRNGTPVIVGLQPFVSQVTYLSDLKPVSYRHQPFLTVDWPYHLDRNVDGTLLRCNGQRYEKGIGMHSVASLSFRLDQPYQRLEAALGIDDSTNIRGSVVFRVYIDDGSGKWQHGYESKVVRGGDAPMEMAIDVSGAKTLRLVVDMADRGDEWDHANWLDARLVPAP